MKNQRKESSSRNHGPQAGEKTGRRIHRMSLRRSAHQQSQNQDHLFDDDAYPNPNRYYEHEDRA